MRVRSVFYETVACLALGGCHEPGDASSRVAAQSTEADVSSTGEMYFLSEDALAEQKRLAKGGDVVAANRVADHYSFAELNEKETVLWLTLAAEKGDIVAMQDVALRLSAMGGAANCELALNWYRRAKGAMSPEAALENGVDGLIRRIEAGAGCND